MSELKEVCFTDFVTRLYHKFRGDVGIQPKMQAAIVAFLVGRDINGDILEIGAYLGNTTKAFSVWVEKTDKKVYVLDPYNGEQQGSDQVFKKFLETTKGSKNIIHYREESQSDLAGYFLRNHKFMYAFIDGLHTYEGALSDLTNLASSLSVGGAICLDDTNIVGVGRALTEFLGKNENFVLLPKPENSLGVYNPPHKHFEFLSRIW